MSPRNVTLILLAVALAFMLGLVQPFIREGFTLSALGEASFRLGAEVSILFPCAVAYSHPPSRCPTLWRPVVYVIRITPLILSPVGYATLFINPILGIIFLVVAILLLFALHAIWRKVANPFPHWSPARAVYEEGLQELARETDPRERQKLSMALQRFKDGWRLK